MWDETSRRRGRFDCNVDSSDDFLHQSYHGRVDALPARRPRSGPVTV